APDKRRPVRLVRDAIVLVDVLDRRRSPVEHRPAADAALERESPPLPQWADRVLVDVVAAVAVTDDEGGAVCARQPARGAAHDLLHIPQRGRERQALHRADQLLQLLLAQRRLLRRGGGLRANSHLRHGDAYRTSEAGPRSLLSANRSSEPTRSRPR